MKIFKKFFNAIGKYILVGLLVIIIVAVNLLNFFPFGFFATPQAQAAPGTQIKTVEFYVHQFAPDALTATVAATITSGNGIKNTAWPASCGDANDASVTINLPESSIVVRKAWVEWFSDLEGLANSTNTMRFCNTNTTATPTTTSFTNVRSTDGVENMPVYLMQDVTSQIAAGNLTYYFNGRLTGSTRGTDSVKLFITYEYDDTSVTQLKTVKYFAGCKATESAEGTTDTYTVNPQIPEASVSIAQSFIEYSGQSDGQTPTDGIVFAGFNGTNPSLAAGIDDANRSSHEWRTLWNTATASVNLNTNNTITLVNNNDPEFLKCAEWILNYTYNNSTSGTQLRTIHYGIGQDINTLNDVAQETLGARAIDLPDLATPATNVRSSWIHLHGEPSAASTLTPQVNITGAAGPSTGPAFNFGFKSNSGMIHIVWDIKTFFNAEWANGDTLTVAGQCGAADACSAVFAEFYITYAYSTSQTTGIKTVQFLSTQDLVQNAAGVAHIDTFSTFLPEAGVKTFRNGATMDIGAGGNATVDMVLTAAIDSTEVAGTSTISVTSLVNAEEHDHRILLVHSPGGQLTNNSQSGITVSLNHTNGTHLDGAITYSTYEYPLPTGTITVGTIGVQTVNMTIPSTNNNVGGAFTFALDFGLANVTSITITENGTVNAQTGLDNIKLRYDLDIVTPYDCASESYAITDTQYGATDTDGFSSANGTSTFTGSVTTTSTTAICMYVELDITSSAVNNETLDIRITASTDVVVSAGSIGGTFPLDIADSTTLQVAAATVSCSSNISSTSFGTLTIASVFTSSPNASTTMSCSNTSSGCALYVADAGNGSNPGLATTSPAYLIPSNTATLSAGAEGYGIQATTTAAGSGGALGVNAVYNKINNDVGGLSLSAITLASSTIDASGREIVATHKATVSSITLSGNYSDTITYSCVVN